jgi:uncharacterized membrane protein YoaK (UPF0700 family)
MKERFSWPALALSAVAGSVDGVGYLLLAKIFTSHMSGNSVLVTIEVARGNWPEAWRHFEPIVAFFFAVTAGFVITDVLTALKFSRRFSIIAALEVALLLAFLFLAHAREQWVVVFPAAAMGIQNALIRRAGEHTVRTTFITGMLTNAAQGLVEAIGSSVKRTGKTVEKMRDYCYYGAIWFCFVAGGICGVYIDLAHGPVALLLPICALAAMIAFDLHRPLAPSAEPAARP